MHPVRQFTASGLIAYFHDRCRPGRGRPAGPALPARSEPMGQRAVNVGRGRNPGGAGDTGRAYPCLARIHLKPYPMGANVLRAALRAWMAAALATTAGVTAACSGGAAPADLVSVSNGGVRGQLAPGRAGLAATTMTGAWTRWVTW